MWKGWSYDTVFDEVFFVLLMCVEIYSVIRMGKSDVPSTQFIIQVGSLEAAHSQLGKLRVLILLFPV